MSDEMFHIIEPEEQVWHERKHCLETVANDPWIVEELENGNFHSVYGHYGFLMELARECDERIKEFQVE